MRQRVLIVAVVAYLTGCAAHPSSIQPTYVSERHYKGWTCDDLRAEYSEVSTRFLAAYELQRGEASADAMGVFLIAIPAGGMGSADMEAQIAQYKGILITIQALGERQQCGIEPIEMPKVVKSCAGSAAKRSKCRKAQKTENGG